ncbi:MFS transporter [Puniceicoccales bacterium CK1056]|uniref:MFS transporter n=1 Tax=Oceanipulchritudo coccoides TaxID=2706888 RepID=A0A6B2M2D4_9BACT|nr:MFS transporter [Oceanipulchritudo coccoides]NDV61880.1 MFS transporter [Oceanipulchritudo coccoides]
MSTSLPPLSKSRIFGYSLGDLGINLNFQMIGFYLAYFYTDVFGISPGHVAGLFLVARIWDAVNDPIMGYIADHTKSRWGRFRPYLLFMAIPLNLMLVACFFTPEISVEAKVVYAYVTYLLHGMVFTALGLPYSSIAAVMTQDQQERSVIASFRMFFAVIIGMSIIAVGVRPMVAAFSSEQTGFSLVSIIFAIASTLLIWLAFRFSQERVEVPKERYHLKDIITIIRKNDALLILGLAMILNTGVWVIGNAVALYFFKYILGDAGLQPIFFFVMIPFNLLGVILAPMLTKWIGKRQAFILGSFVVAVFALGRYFVPDSMIWLLFVVSALGTVGQMACSVTQWGMVPDTVEYGHWKTGFRSEGIPIAFFSFSQKVGMALAGAFAAYVLSLTGYVANTELTAQAAEGIRWLFNIFPGLCSVLCLLSLLFYKLTGERYEQILIDLQNNRFHPSVGK